VSVILIIIYSLLVFYALVSFAAAYGFFRTQNSANSSQQNSKITVIVCARNEEKNISYCLQSLMIQKYDPADFELILVDDNSHDRTLSTARNILQNARFKYKIISNNTHHGKKQSIRRAVSEAQHPLIVTRDADTFTVSDTWLQSISRHYQKTKADFIIGPVSIANYSGLMWALQAVENNVLTLFSAGSAYYRKAFLCSGANLVFTKTIFEKCGAYASHLHIPSGDCPHRLRSNTLELFHEALGSPVIAAVKVSPREEIRLGVIRLVVEEVLGQELLLQLVQSVRVQEALLKLPNGVLHQPERCIGRGR